MCTASTSCGRREVHNFANSYCGHFLQVLHGVLLETLYAREMICGPTQRPYPSRK